MRLEAPSHTFGTRNLKTKEIEYHFQTAGLALVS